MVLLVSLVHRIEAGITYNSNVTRAPEIIKRYRSNESYIDKSLIDLDLKYCQRPARCESLKHQTCMGSKLPYQSTTLDLTDLMSQEEVQEKLMTYQYLRYIPKCWAVIQPFLCALYMPKCENDMVNLPSELMCKITLGPCKILYNASIFPEFMRCEDERLFPSQCKNDVHKLKFNTTGFCMEPLVRTEQANWFYNDIEGCGLRCKDALYTEDEHFQIHKLIACCVIVCIVLILFTVVTFVIDWKTANPYYALAIFYTNVCFLISYLGWSVQFLGNDYREGVVCKKGGTLRRSEPSASENLWCAIVFVMVYYFLIAGMVWFVVFTYTWHMSCLQALGKIQERVDKKKAYFHLVAWSLPLVLTITTMALGEIDGDYVAGICFVNSSARTGLLLTPLTATILIAGYFVTRGLVLLVRVKIESREIISEHASHKIRSNIVRMGVNALFMLIISVVIFVYHVYLSINTPVWELSLYNFILCKLTSLSPDNSHCRQEDRPSVAMLQLYLIAVFGTGIAMASWIWCKPTIHVWTRYIQRKFDCEVDEPMKLQKHKIIAEAFAKRKKLNHGGRISIECQNHTDPVGLKFDLNSAASNELSTTWAQNLMRFVTRRGAVPNEVTCSVSSNNQSVDSEMSYSVRHVSIESRRNSGDSQLSVQIAELKATRKVNGRRRRCGGGSGGRYSKQNDFRKRIGKSGGGGGSKRGSSTSLDSHLGHQLLNVLAASNNKETRKFIPNMSRRSANAGLDAQNLSKLSQMLFNNSKSVSEDENVSVTISESKFNVIVNHNNMDLNDQLVMKSLHKGGGGGGGVGGLKIEELSTSESEEERNHQYKAINQVTKKKYSCDSDSDSDTSSCPELKQLVQSSLNSGNSVAYYEKNRGGSKQSKTSIDVAVQANAKEIMTQTGSYDMEMKTLNDDSDDGRIVEMKKSKQLKTKENKHYKNADEKYYSKVHEAEGLLGMDKYRPKIRSKSKEKY
ncbi:PREDICTED: protein smoothened isoform X2 [Nicrophorus vespilloides]|nr:PREDICTED: protein smoothened isoform X2 [Nicrophorus vespilloides]